MRKDAYSNVKVVPAINPAVKTDAENGATIDRKGYDSALIVVQTGAIVSAGDFGFKLHHSNTTENGDFVDVTAADLIGTPPAAAMTATTAYRASYIGKRRYIRVSTIDNGGTSVVIGAVAVLGSPHLAPVA